MDMQTRDILKRFGISTTAARLPWVLEVPKGKKTFRIEVSKTKNENAPWHADGYRESGQSWKLIEDFRWVDHRSKATAISDALDFLGF